MFNRDLFKYDEENHLGYYNDQLVPSVTQLLDILFPLDEDIPEERLKTAAERGSKKHARLEEINKCFDNPYSYEQCFSNALKIALEIGDVDVLNYLGFIHAYKLRPFDYENLVFVVDENDELICYGHYDLTCVAIEDTILFQEGHLYMFDYKTTSVFDKKKTEWQLSIYALAYEQMSKNYITNIHGLHLRDGIKDIPLTRKDNIMTVNILKKLKESWCARR